MLFVVDTSCLIVLQRLDWLEEFLSHADDTFICPPRVIQELKNNTMLLKWLKTGIVGITNIDKPILMTGISVTDAEVVALALERSGSILSEDTLLSEKAQKLALPVYNLSRLIVLFYQYGRFTHEDCLARLKILADEHIISKIFYRQLMENIGL